MTRRWKAVGTHLLLSLLIIGMIATFAFSLWYPQGLWRIASLDRLLVVMLTIDVIAGPLLTAIIYRPGKPGLKFDLGVIALLQLAFLGYGLHTLWQARPIFLVATPDVLTVVFAAEVSDRDLAKGSRPEYRHRSLRGPVLVGTRMPDDPQARSAIIKAFMAGGAGIERSPQHYVPFEDVSGALLQASKPVAAVHGIPRDAILSTGLPATQLRYVPAASTRGSGIAILDARTGRPIETLALELD